MGILDSFRRQKEIDKLSENYYTEGVENMTPEELEKYKKTVDEMREKMESPVHTDGTKIVNKSYPNFDSNVSHEEYEKILEKNLTIEDEFLFKTETGYSVFLRHAKCPECGTEVISKTPTLYNQFNFEHFSNFTCGCCQKNFCFEYSYPRIVMLDLDNNEVKYYV